MKSKLLLTLAAGLFIFVSCKKDEDPIENPPVPPNEEETITTLTVTLTDTVTGAITTASFSDPDGIGGNAPTIDTIRVSPNTVYRASVTFLDESDPNDVENITAEIEEEDDEHLVCYTPASANLTVNITDADDNGLPVGLTSFWNVINAANETLTISLKHQPDVKDGTCAPGETDIETTFPLLIQ